MNTTFKTKLLLHLNHKKQESGQQGFTLIELLVVIIIIGILAAIALPSFLNQANKGKQAEGKQYASAVNKAQQAFFTENGAFASYSSTDATFTSLGVGIKTQTANYNYSVSSPSTNGSTASVSVLATALSGALKGYAGTVALIGGTSDSTSQAIVCEANNAGTATPTAGAVSGNNLGCGSGMTAIK